MEEENKENIEIYKKVIKNLGNMNETHLAKLNWFTYLELEKRNKDAVAEEEQEEKGNKKIKDY